MIKWSIRGIATMSTMLDRAEADPGGADRAARTAGSRMPRPVLWAVAMAIGGLIAGAMYLMAVRGDALMLDLSVFRFFCS